MPRHVGEDDDWDEEPADDHQEFDDIPDDSEEATIPCPHCRRQIHEDSQRCPYCEHYVTEEDGIPARKPWWIIVGALACLYVVYRWIAV
jgi:hypothetical protein